MKRLNVVLILLTAISCVSCIGFGRRSSSSDSDGKSYINFGFNISAPIDDDERSSKKEWRESYKESKEALGTATDVMKSCVNMFEGAVKLMDYVDGD